VVFQRLEIEIVQKGNHDQALWVPFGGNWFPGIDWRLFFWLKP
jgi:hypothetical protein